MSYLMGTTNKMLYLMAKHLIVLSNARTVSVLLPEIRAKEQQYSK